MPHHGGFLHNAQGIAAPHLVPRLYRRDEMPARLPVQGGDLDPPLQIGAGYLHDLGQRTLDPIKNRADQAGAQLHAQRRAGGFHRFAGPEPRGLLVYLDGGLVSMHFDDFADQTLAAHPHHVEHVGVPHPLGDDQRARDLGYRTCRHMADRSFHRGVFCLSRPIVSVGTPSGDGSGSE